MSTNTATYQIQHQILTEKACDYIIDFFKKNPKFIIHDFVGTKLNDTNDVIQTISRDGVELEDTEGEVGVYSFNQMPANDIMHIATCIQENYDKDFGK